MKDYNGSRAERFPKLPALNIGPASYNVDEVTTLSRQIASKTHSCIGVYATTAKRFVYKIEEAPAPDNYEPKNFLQILDKHITSRRPILSNHAPKSSLDSSIKRNNIPGPGTYDINSAIGRHVANDTRFVLLKSSNLKNRDAKNKQQMTELRAMLNAPDIFTDKRACRRMAHLALYFP